MVPGFKGLSVKPHRGSHMHGFHPGRHVGPVCLWEARRRVMWSTLASFLQGALRNLACDESLLQDVLAAAPPEHLANLWTPAHWGGESGNEKEAPGPADLQEPKLDLNQNS